MPTRFETIRLAIDAFENAIYPDGLNSRSVWLGLYQTLLWYQAVDHWGYDALPHIIDADKFRVPKTRAADDIGDPTPWVVRAAGVHEYLAVTLRCEPSQVALMMDRLMRGPEFEGLQRQNSLGIAFAGLVKHVLERFGPEHVSYEAEKPAKTVFPGLPLVGRSEKPSIDVLATSNGAPLAVISTKWSLRHDRLNDLTSEAPAYKAAFMQLYRQRGRPDLKYYVVTNEFDPARLTKLIDDPGIDSVVHVHKHAVTDVCQLDGRLQQLVDFPDFIAGFVAP